MLTTQVWRSVLSEQRLITNWPMLNSVSTHSVSMELYTILLVDSFLKWESNLNSLKSIFMTELLYGGIF